MAGRPLVLPEPFTGEGSWDQWISHFENNTWDDAAKLLWLRARLTKRAQTAYQNVSEEAKATYGESKKALKERFEPKCRRELSTRRSFKIGENREQKAGLIMLKI